MSSLRHGLRVADAKFSFSSFYFITRSVNKIAINDISHIAHCNCKMHLQYHRTSVDTDDPERIIWRGFESIFLIERQ